MKRKRGNILFLILLAVVLFAALAYAVTSSMRGGGRDASSESAETGTAAVLQWFSGLDAAVMRMSMNGIRHEDISFVYDSRFYEGGPINNYMDNTRCASDECRVFRPSGGGMTIPDFTRSTTTHPTGLVAGSSPAPGTFRLLVMQWPGAGTDRNDIVVMVRYIKPEICTRLNRAMGITATPAPSGTITDAHIVANWDDPAAQVFSANAAQLYGKDMFAYNITGSGDGRYCHVYHMVIAR